MDVTPDTPQPEWQLKYMPEVEPETKRNTAILAVLDALATTIPLMYACRAAGIGRTTFWDWEAANPDLKICRLVAEARGIVEAGRTVLAAFKEKKGWLPAMTVLERRTVEFRRSQDIRTVAMTLSELLSAEHMPSAEESGDTPIPVVPQPNGETPS